ncbi:hypothetical protein DACRYDRAFT_119109 [Dacryopinax primogenitus]|uniref:Protein kinase domain-containing protein n=1 Tax=Dacryopinax primogenitus (strain DJM 731) TaxID=1858805 RepID=M5FNT8_DACPD|nr:uncharacterized protein DACRYDRAFT_119109 [Dacryopinax primogenitus]EJT97915.1 hypothetical protein DACRYDRAFT_119109 [Dacryopinax primogenitus]
MMNTSPMKQSFDINAPYGLNAGEHVWRSIAPILARRGYTLRPRYHDGWVGSWVGTNKRPEECEDSIVLGRKQLLLDAKWRSGSNVMLKLWFDNFLDRVEPDVLQYFSHPSRINDSANHCVPLLDMFQIPGQPFVKVLVEPLLRSYNEPPFIMVAEALSFVLQTLEGLEYMHLHNIAHGDISHNNILMDTHDMFPDGFHGAFTLNPGHRMSETGLLRLTRIQAPPKYYYIDFGSSCMCRTFMGSALVLSVATSFVPPEIKDDRTKAYDPFRGDVFSLGMTFLAMVQNRPGLTFLLPMIRRMTVQSPSSRPTVFQIKRHFLTIVLRNLTKTQMIERIGWEDTSKMTTFERAFDTKEHYAELWNDVKRYGLPVDLLTSGTTDGAP